MGVQAVGIILRRPGFSTFNWMTLNDLNPVDPCGFCLNTKPLQKTNTRLEHTKFKFEQVECPCSQIHVPFCAHTARMCHKVQLLGSVLGSVYVRLICEYTIGLVCRALLSP